MDVSPAAVIRLFRERKRPLSDNEVVDGLRAGRVRRQQVRDILDDLVEEGRLIRIDRAYGLTESMNLMVGRLEIQRSGVGYVIPDDKRRKDLFISQRDMGDAWHGDRVAAAVTRERTGKNHEGRVARILERGHNAFPCRVIKRMGKDLFLCRPTDPRQPMSFMADYRPAAGGKEPSLEDIITVTAGEKLEYRIYSGSATALLGPQRDAAVQEKLVKINHEVPSTFPRRTLAEAGALPEEPGEADFAGRQDLRKVPFVTIDGAKARDFDDAVHVEKISRGYRLRVAIADVSHYVPEGSALDKEALERGNSYYFPQSVEPMFPERLSNGLCSLNPHVPRLAMVADMKFSDKGIIRESVFYTAVIQSAARLTYAQVNQGLLLGDEEARKTMAPVMPMLEKAEKLARLLRGLRQERGTLDFDLPEPEIHFNLDGEPVDIRPRVRHFGHQIVEEFMIAANEAVARFLTEQETPLLYRIHPDPDPAKLEALFKLLGTTSLATSLPAEPGPGDLNLMLRAAAETDLDFLVSRLALRTMMQASYSPRHEGHFGLASVCYCHFTSPIRRYADLIVHRAIKKALAGEGPGWISPIKLQKAAEHLSRRERVAMEAEREILKRITVLFLEDKVGQEFTGVIGSLADFGFWVELKEVMAEGMVRLSTITDDYYGFFPERQELLGERTGRAFRLGQTITVELMDVGIDRLEVNLRLLEGGEMGEPGGRKGKPRAAGSSKSGRSGRSGRSGGSGEQGKSTKSKRSKKTSAAPGAGAAPRTAQAAESGDAPKRSSSSRRRGRRRKR
ncbi:ribonuclease R [Desulfovibrio sulfodismutans]|uniref:Ribonuclease R n=1 Tax=Desulfolutivibrio sulfodismutans TaxID=63561 RepID=A0A7K3NKU7_9BACT|nr:ribonuclease R [Desulfolutivibrio sulfodismutans]NDY56828.1 ribonuclease R [Desulfolutivibrio sulfodismutans]QLA14570.1 ribonuclease R [Desulfolutivibrio sulfodismutans DSM 3696]